MLSERLSEIAAYCRVEADDAELPGFVDAAAAYLAGAGVREPQDGSPRYAQYLRRMTDNTQFIVITHRRGTMEAADVLYGVTMQEDGVSKILRLDLDKVNAELIT